MPTTTATPWRAARRATWPSPVPTSSTRTAPDSHSAASGRICSSYSGSAPSVNPSCHHPAWRSQGSSAPAVCSASTGTGTVPGGLLQPRRRPADHNGMSGPSVTAVVLAYGAEPWLAECIDALQASTGLGGLEIVLVDNGAAGDEVEGVAGRDGLTVLRPGR